MNMKNILLYTGLIIALPCSAWAQKIDRTHLPAAGPAPVVQLKDPVITHLSNGITLLVVEDHRFPVVSASLYIDQGPVTEGPKSGVMDLMGDILAEGTTNMSKAEFDATVDRLGANIGFNSSGGSVEALSRFFPRAFDLMAQALKSPAMTEASFEKLRVQLLTGLKSQDKDVQAIASRVTGALAYGKSSPFGEFATLASVQALTLADVTEAYKRYITPSRAYLTVVGDITPAMASKLAGQAFGTWKGRVLSLPVIATVDNPVQSEIDVVDVPTAVQTNITLVNLNQLRLTAPDFFAAQLANFILGGGSDAYLFKSLREKRGFTYGAYSKIGAGRYQTLFSANAAVRTAKTDSAIMEFMTQIKRIREHPVTDEELKNAKALFNGSFALSVEDPSRTAAYARNILINDLPKDYYRTYLQKINAVTVADVGQAAQKYFSYDHTRIIAVGNAAQFLDNLKQLTYPVIRYDRFAEPEAK
jgi:zinc protease